MRFYLGTHMPAWLGRSSVPLFVSHRRLEGRRSFPRAVCGWALDSGGFSELSMFGEWRTTADAYAAAVVRYAEEIGLLEWAAPQDWMCEPFMVEKTGLSVSEHQRRTVDSFVDLSSRGLPVPVVPVLQGWEPDEYLRHVDMYEAAGVDLVSFDTVGLGSVCRRQATGEAERVVHSLQPIRLHGFGMKTEALARFGDVLASADSMAWSFAGRRRPDPQCVHKSCANCEHYALEWRDHALSPSSPSLWGLVDV